ncbi:MAG TPA: NAD(P)-binding domain-containing protein, partial [Alphaproteobacteria bacterium]|nr:NAD(P)-binding domain-containing protein [Alphaproteobacteria bacterium]
MDAPRIVVIGLGYVGLPLAVALARHFPVLGFDISRRRVDELQAHHDRTGEVDDAVLAETGLELSHEAAGIAGADIYIVTVPTPVDADNRPDLSALKAACDTVGPALKPGAVVVFESTVYPGVTEEICGPALE